MLRQFFANKLFESSQYVLGSCPRLVSVSSPPGLFIFRPHKWGRKIMICDAFFFIFCPHRWGRKIMICDAFFFTNFAKTPLISTHGLKCNSLIYLLAIVTTEFFQLWWFSQVVGLGFEPGLVLELLFVFPPVGRGFELLLRHTFFCTKRVAEHIPVLSGRLVSSFAVVSFHLSNNPLSSINCEFNQKHSAELVYSSLL